MSSLMQTILKRLMNKENDSEQKPETINELKQYTTKELDSATYKILDVYRVTLTRKVSTKNMPEPKKEVKSILAIRIKDNMYMDIESGNYYKAELFISDLNQCNIWTSYEMPFRYYACETLMDKCIDWSESLTARQFRDIIRLQKEKYKHPMYDCKKWDINR